MRYFKDAWVVWLFSWGYLIALSSCGEIDRAPAPPEEIEEELPPLFMGAGVQDRCEATEDCRSGLTCVSQKCVTLGETPEDGSCLLTDECADGLICGWAGFCVKAGGKNLGEECAQDGECKRGNYCDRTGGIAGECALRMSGSADVEEACEENVDCREGLVCSPDREEKVCLPGSLFLNPDVFRGVACDESGEAEMPFGMRHALPSSGADFFATPFPSDLRLYEGHVDLSDYPRPGAALNSRDLFGHLLDLIEDLRHGWSRNPGIYLRFTRPLSSEQIERGLEDHFRLIDLETGDRHPFEVRFHSERNKYICARYVFLHPSWAKPLTPGHSYAVIVLRSIRSEEDDRPTRLDATELLLADRMPRGANEKAAWERFASLRRWIKNDNIGVSDVVGASVFTVEEDQGVIKRGREAVYDANLVSFDPSAPPVLCKAGVQSPCALDNESLAELTSRGISVDPRACPEEENPLFHEIHAKVLMPVYQKGRPPYAIEDGEVRVDSAGRALLSTYHSICMAITVPKGIEPPEDGWPVVIYGHGTGGNFRAGVNLLGSQLSSLRAEPDPEAEEGAIGELKPVVMIAIDQVMHGTRLGENQFLAPGPLFFNVQNPGAARGNLIQGALDNFALVRFITQSSDLHEWNFPELDHQLLINRERVSYHGHSQGGTTGPLFAPFEDRITGVALSGTAGGLMFSLLDKKEPYDAMLGLQIALQEFSMTGDHPALHVFQEYFDDVDPINYADQITKLPDGKPLHLLHIYGRHDSFTPDSGQRSFAAASGATLGISTEVSNDFDPIDDLNILTQAFPLEANLEVRSVGRYTAVVVQHTPEQRDGRDLYNGHYVAYRNPEASRQLLQFLRDLSLGIPPKVNE